MLRPEFDRAQVLREILRACRNGGTISVPGAYVGWVDKLPVGSLMNRSLTIRTRQTHVQHYLKPLLEHRRRGDYHPERLITHRRPLDDAPRAYARYSLTPHPPPFIAADGVYVYRK